MLQKGPKKDYIDAIKPHTKELVSDKVPSIHKTIIANIMTLMILQEELQKDKTPKK